MATNTQELTSLSIGEAARLIQRKKLSPVELTQAYLDRIALVDSYLHSYLMVFGERALAEAKRAEVEIAHGRYRGPLHGIPLAHKDLYDVKGVRTSGQSKVFEQRVPSADATVIAKLRRAGAILTGKLAMNELADGGWALAPQTRNPWDGERATGGSSAGSAAAVAAELCAGSMGSDTGGSIRGPASHCGIVGFKPTYGRVSRHGVLVRAWSFDHCGPMTHTAEDAALMLQAVAGYDAKDPASSRKPVPDYVAALQGGARLRIGVPREFIRSAAPEVASAFERALGDLVALGAQVRDVAMPSLAYTTVAHLVIEEAECFAYHWERLRTRPQEFGQTIRRRLYGGALLSAADYVRAQQARSRVQRELTQVFGEVDLVATPTTPSPAPLAKGTDPEARFFQPNFGTVFNLTGAPAITLPCGFTPGGLPIGLQLAGRPFEEATVLRAAYAYQQGTAWHTRRPPSPAGQARPRAV